jgi:two-component system sensor kinase ParS
VAATLRHRLTLLDSPPALDAQEQAAVKADGFIVRDQYQQVLLPIDGIGGRWLHLRLPARCR